MSEVRREILCRCCFVFEDTVREVIQENELTTVDQVSYHCNAGSRCGGCRKKIAELIEEELTDE
ncbi:(2Fe-2S)-binding protein [Pontiellaceae bacterium B12219]|nr:(2Fe-2S)-binding protein [Pontiellaceae bacterium B12219]